jgi:hypothetical protein
MKTVVFASTEDCVRSTIAATFFDAFSLPKLVRALPVSNRLEHTPPALIYCMEEIGLHVPAQPQIMAAGILEAATLIIRFGDLRTPAMVPTEQWDVSAPGGGEIGDMRLVRNALRSRVWRLIAKNGWYRLQPVQALAFRA